ncbi:MAG: sialate O-acetylesterase [Isosphaeraceae bacterium]
MVHVRISWCYRLFRLSGCLLAVLLVAPAGPARADVKLPAIFGDHMVLQRDQQDKVWGWADPGEEVTVQVAPQGQTKQAKADADGKWHVMLDPLPVGGPYTITVKGKNTITFQDVLSGEVWICSGQSNMQWPVAAANDPDLEIKAARFPGIRLITVPNRGTQEPQKDFDGHWSVCSPETVPGFSAVGYFFGRQLHQTLGVPIGLINDAWGGSACEAWIPRDRLAADPKYKALLDRWARIETEHSQDRKAHEGEMRGNARPGNIYNGVLLPTIGYGIRGAIWYQGESNAGRAYQYRDLFPLMIQTWRDLWKQGDFSFYWVQLADFMDEKAEPAESAWAELREAQTMTMKRLPHTGEAVIIDIGEGKDIHPRNKQDVAMRLARWALAKDYGVTVPCQSPTYASMSKQDGKIAVKFDHVDGGFRPFDVNEPRGFTIAGPDRKFVPAKAKIVGPNTIEVWSESISDPAAVRYAWADNPVCNLYSNVGLPATPFRTDDWPGVTINNQQ